MSSFFSTLGRMIIFAGLLPGIVGTSIYFFLTGSLDKLPPEEPQTIIIMVIVFGFFANSIGHFIDEIFRCITKTKNKPNQQSSPFVRVVVLKSKNLIDDNTEKQIMNKTEYLESLRAFYLNSSVIVSTIIVYFIINNGFTLFIQQWFIVTAGSFTIVAIWFLVKKINDHIKKMLSELENKL